MNASWQGFVSRVLEGSTTIAPVIHVPALVRPVAFAGSAFFAIASLASARLSDADEHSRDRSLLLVFLGAILASPLGWVYYLPLAYGPMLGWLAARWPDILRQRRNVVVLFVALACLYVPQEVASSVKNQPVAALTLSSVYFWGVLLLWVTVHRFDSHGHEER
jgi:hypothetical protein